MLTFAPRVHITLFIEYHAMHGNFIPLVSLDCNIPLVIARIN